MTNLAFLIEIWTIAVTNEDCDWDTKSHLSGRSYQEQLLMEEDKKIWNQLQWSSIESAGLGFAFRTVGFDFDSHSHIVISLSYIIDTQEVAIGFKWGRKKPYSDWRWEVAIISTEWEGLWL